MKIKILIALSLLMTTITFSQTGPQEGEFETFVIDSDIISLVETLVGDDISVFNITSNVPLSSHSVGLFYNTNSVFQLQAGLVMSTGYIDSIGTPNTNGGTTTDLGLNGDPDLAQLLNGNYQIFDAVTIEFDYIPFTNKMNFSYILGSEEFPEYANSNFNDVFGFFVSGEGIDGPFTNNAVNIARLPNSSDFVTIYNINNSAYFIENHNEPVIEMEYDGFTTALDAAIEVVPFTTYHIKLAVGDTGDPVYDTGVFIGKKSLHSIPLKYTIQEEEIGESNSITLTENAGTLSIDVELPAIAQSDITYHYQLLGTAENGVDYQVIGNSITIPEGSRTASIDITILNDDDTDEGTEEIELILDGINDTIHINIQDETVLGIPSNVVSTFDISPNPTNGNFNIRLTEKAAFTNVTIFNIDGKIVFENTYQSDGNMAIRDLTIAGGIYFVKVTTDKFSDIRRIVVE